jgi:hypothetical protein
VEDAALPTPALGASSPPAARLGEPAGRHGGSG